MAHEQGIRIAQSCAADPRAAVAELAAGLAQPALALVIFFCSNTYDREALAAALRAAFVGVEVVGCTTAGEIGPAGCREGSLSGVSFSSAVACAAAGRLDDLAHFELAAGKAFAAGLLVELSGAAPAAFRQRFAFLLVDGLSVREELLAHALQEVLGELPLIGGSAGDGLAFGATYVYHEGRFHSGSAVLVAVATPLAVKEFKTQHFVPTNERLVVTAADPARRVVAEINGSPAAAEYARILGVSAAELTPESFAASPVVVLIDGANYVRSIQKANPDGSLTFFCAIESGVVLRVAKGVDLFANLERALAEVRAQVGPVQLLLACDCILRKLEIVAEGLEESVGALLAAHHAVGFNTYGEQFCGVHVNQTLTGIALGAPREARGG